LRRIYPRAFLKSLLSPRCKPHSGICGSVFKPLRLLHR
jgi:hypothetical protein